jgi:hypothetical protein
MSQKFVNAPISWTLNGAIDDNDTTLIVTSNTGVPASGQFEIGIDSERLLVTSYGTTTWTVTRAYAGSTAAAHSDGAQILPKVSWESFDQRFSDNFVIDTYGNIPSIERSGKIFVPNNGNLIHYDNGTTRNPLGPIFNLSPVPTSGWTELNIANEGSTSFNNYEYTIKSARNDIGSASNNFRIVHRATLTPPYTVTAAFLAAIQTAYDNSHLGYDLSSFGLVLRQSSDGKIINFGLNGYLAFLSSLWDSVTDTSANAVYLDNSYYLAHFGLLFLRIRDDNTNRYFDYSSDGINFNEIFSNGRTVGLTANQIGFYLNQVTKSAGYCKLISWKEESS